VHWTWKLKAASEVSVGVNYLHTIPGGPVIHGDVKIGNVLVGHGYQAKVQMMFMIFLMTTMTMMLDAVAEIATSRKVYKYADSDQYLLASTARLQYWAFWTRQLANCWEPGQKKFLVTVAKVRCGVMCITAKRICYVTVFTGNCDMARQRTCCMTGCRPLTWSGVTGCREFIPRDHTWCI